MFLWLNWKDQNRQETELDNRDVSNVLSSMVRTALEVSDYIFHFLTCW